MSLDPHVTGDCDPWSCLRCVHTCDVCGLEGLPCACPQLPLDDDEEA